MRKIYASLLNMALYVAFGAGLGWFFYAWFTCDAAMC